MGCMACVKLRSKPKKAEDAAAAEQSEPKEVADSSDSESKPDDKNSSDAEGSDKESKPEEKAGSDKDLADNKTPATAEQEKIADDASEQAEANKSPAKDDMVTPQ